MADKTALDMRYLNVPLPEDLMKLKWGGDYERLISVIDRRLADETLPAPLRKRLQLERILAARIPSQYPYSYEEALALLRANIRDFKDKELETLWEENTADWIYINGRVQFHELFFENLMKTRDDYGARFLGTMEDNEKNAALLRENVRLMEEHGGRTVHMRLLTRLSLTPEAEKACMGKTAHVYMPLPVEYAQVRNLRLLGFEGTAGEPVSVDNGSYPQRTARFETVIRGGEVWQTEFEFDNETVFRNPDPSQVLFSQPSFYTGEEAPHIRFTPYLRELTRSVTEGEENPLLAAEKIYRFITSQVKYSFVRSYSTVEDIPEFTAANRKGDCGFQALLFITMCRIAGIPARWQSGLYATPLTVGSHDWAQYYVAPFGWLSADCSFGGSAFRQGDEKRRAYYGANLDPYRIPYASQFMHSFSREEEGLRDDPYDNQSGEVFCGGRFLRSGKEFTVEYRLETAEKPFDGTGK
mgnify:FL=1